MATKRVNETADWYDYPQYFDMVFRDETAAEVDFFTSAFETLAEPPVTRLLEPGCGSGRLVATLAGRGFEVTGVDRSAASLAYLRRKLRRRGLNAQLVQADISALQLDQTYDAAFCTFNTFRHLTDEASAVSHLRSVAEHLRPGGIYILGLHIIPLDADKQCIERWKARHGSTSVHVTLRVVDFDRRRRLEQIEVLLTAITPRKTVRCRTRFPLRLYTAQQLQSTLANVPQLSIAGVYDFDYDIDSPRQIDDDLIDAVLVLKKVDT